MIKNYETPSIEIIEYETEIETSSTSTIFDYPWADEGDSSFFE